MCFYYKEADGSYLFAHQEVNDFKFVLLQKEKVILQLKENNVVVSQEEGFFENFQEIFDGWHYIESKEKFIETFEQKET